MTNTASSTKHNVLGFHFDAISYEGVFESILNWHHHCQSRLISLVNPYSVLLGQCDQEMASAIKASSLVLADGVGIVHAGRLLGYPSFDRVTGPALMLKICDWSRLSNLRHYFYGGSETVVKELVENLQANYPGLQVAGFESPPYRDLTAQEDAEAVSRINASGADIVWVGLGAPKQEKWMLEHLGKIHAAALIGVGAAFDFHAGSVPWAPQWMRQCGIEWAYRLYQEPKRMWRRNLGSLEFLIKVMIQMVSIRLLRRHDSLPVPEPACYDYGPLPVVTEQEMPVLSA